MHQALQFAAWYVKPHRFQFVLMSWAENCNGLAVDVLPTLLLGLLGWGMPHSSSILFPAVKAEELGRETANIPSFPSVKWRLLEQVPCSELLVSWSITCFAAEHSSAEGKLLPSPP